MLFSVVSITFFVLIPGTEFHSYTMREISTEMPERWAFIVQFHALTQGVLFVAFTWMAVIKLVGYKITKQDLFLMAA